jgi:hypothetical protein
MQYHAPPSSRARRGALIALVPGGELVHRVVRRLGHTECGSSAVHFDAGGTMAKDREIIEPKEGDKRFARRDEQGQFEEQDDVGRSLSQDRKADAKSKVKKGQGDRGETDARKR